MERQPHPDEYQDEHEVGDAEDTEPVDETVAGVSAWGISLVTHATVLALMVFVVMVATVKDDQVPLSLTQMPEAAEEPPEPPAELPREEIDIPVDEIVDEPVIETFDMPEEEIQTEDEVLAEVPVKGSDSVAMSEISTAATPFAAIGPNGSSPGAIGPRDGGGRKWATGRYGGSRASEHAVERALRWFMRHQSPNGQWDVDGYPLNCEIDGPRCEPGTAHTSLDGDVACTGYALLCYLGAGYDHRTANRYQMTVAKGIAWLLLTQDAEGLIGRRNYEHPVATMALAEAYAMTNDPNLHDPVQRAVDVIIARQTQDPQAADSAYAGLGWDYIKPNISRMDSSVSGWNVMALKAAKSAGIDVGHAMAGAEAWLQGAWQAANPGWETLDPYEASQFPYTWNGQTDAVNMHDGDLTCVGLLSSVFLGKKAGDPMLDTMANWCFDNQTPAAWPTDTYYMYYNTLGMFQVQGEKWRAWNGVVRDLLVDNQRRGDDCFGGSWDPQGAGGHKISEVGRLLVTAYCTLSLEVYYRYNLAAGTDKVRLEDSL